MANRKNTLVEVLVSGLGTIDGTGDYETSLVEVKRHPVRVQSIESPAIYLTEVNESKEALLGPCIDATVSTEWVAYSREYDEDTVVQELDQILADVERWVGNNTNLGYPQWVVRAHVTESSTFPGLEDDGFGFAEFTITFTYRHERGTP